MEDGLVRFDPTNVEFWDAEVLILVVVEDGLVLVIKNYKVMNPVVVLILVVVEDGLVLIKVLIKNRTYYES